jgi:hypothetical protein
MRRVLAVTISIGALTAFAPVASAQSDAGAASPAGGQTIEAFDITAGPPTPTPTQPAQPAQPTPTQPGQPTQPAQPTPNVAAPGTSAVAPGSTAPGTAASSATPATAPSTTANARLVALVDAAPIGVDPAAGTFVTDTLRASLTQQGYTTVPVPQLYQVARELQLPFPVPSDGLLALQRTLGAPIAVTAEVRAGGGYYQVMLRARFANENGERFRQLLATQWTLGDSLRAALPTLLASPGTPGAGPGDQTAPLLPDMTNVPPPRPHRPVRLHANPWEIAAGFELAIGPGTDSFFNALAYGRLSWFPIDRFGITANVGYANLRSRTGRVSNVLMMAGVETAVEIMPRQRIFLPLRAEAGYLPLNGPVLRGTAGVTFPITPNLRVELDVLSPTIWFLPGTAAVSLDLGAQLIFVTGAPARRHRRRRPTESNVTSTANEPASTPARANDTGE